MDINEIINSPSFEECYNTKLEDICMSSNVSEALLCHGDLVTVADLAKKTKTELLQNYDGIGSESILELEQVLLDFGLTFGIKL
jgi:hypothetical protein